MDLGGFPREFGISDVLGGSRVAVSAATIVIYHLVLFQTTQESLRRIQNAPEPEIRSKFPDFAKLANFGQKLWSTIRSPTVDYTRRARVALRPFCVDNA